MKTLSKSFLALAAFALVSTTAAQATSVLHISGSTAFRSATINAVANVLTSPTAVYYGSSLAGANDLAFQGTYAGNTVQVELHFSGSLTGIAGLTAPASNNYNFCKYQASGTTVTPGGQSNFYSPYGLNPGAGGGFQIASSGSPAAGNSTTTDTSPTDVGFSDAFQNTAALVTAVAKSSPALVDTKVGILPFAFLKGSANTSDNAVNIAGGGTDTYTDYQEWQQITDISSNNVATLYGSGGLDTQLLTGNIADETGVTAVGRDEDSGTRIAAFAESGFGVSSTPTQYEITTSGGASTGPDAVVASVVAQANSSFPTISGGYSSGGNVAAALATTGWDSVGNTYAIAYLGASDTDTAVTEGYEITANVTSITGGNTYTAHALTGSGVTNTVAVGDNVYYDSPTSTAIGTVTAVNTSTLAVTVSTTLASGHNILVDTLTGTGYVRPAFLTYNGVPLTKANIVAGKYTFWEYEHFFYPTSFTSNANYALATAIKSNLISSGARVAGYLLSDLTGANGTPTKSQEGATINLQ